MIKIIGDINTRLSVDDIYLRLKAINGYQESAGNSKQEYTPPINESWVVWYVGGSNNLRAAEMTLYIEMDTGFPIIEYPHVAVAPGGGGEVCSACPEEYFPMVIPPNTTIALNCNNGLAGDLFTTYIRYTRLYTDLVNKEIKL